MSLDMASVAWRLEVQIEVAYFMHMDAIFIAAQTDHISNPLRLRQVLSAARFIKEHMKSPIVAANLANRSYMNAVKERNSGDIPNAKWAEMLPILRDLHMVGAFQPHRF